MNKIFAVVRREFVERVRTKAFVISTVLLPVMMAVFTVIPVLMMSGSDQTSHIAVVDASGSGLGAEVAKMLNEERLGDDKDALARYDVQVHTTSGDTQKLRDSLVAEVDAGKKSDKSLSGVLVLGANTLKDGDASYYGGNVGSTQSMAHLRSSLTRVLATARLAKAGIDPDLAMQAMASAHLRTTKVS
ncbi:MAG: ABC transporter permease, partial [Xanthomonadales bacterium]|nr:ABC transporter permease [Xanthomonadales bacterium]